MPWARRSSVVSRIMVAFRMILDPGSVKPSAECGGCTSLPPASAVCQPTLRGELVSVASMNYELGEKVPTLCYVCTEPVPEGSNARVGGVPACPGCAEKVAQQDA